MPELLTFEDVARRYTVTTRTIRRWVNDGALPAIYLTPRTVRFLAEDVEALISSKRTRKGAVVGGPR